MQELSKLQQINSAIMFGEFTNVELNSIINAIKFARTQLTKEKARTFKVGDQVKFNDSKRGIAYTGSVEKIKLKYAIVRTGQYSRYNVPISILETV